MWLMDYMPLTLSNCIDFLHRDLLFRFLNSSFFTSFMHHCYLSSSSLSFQILYHITPLKSFIPTLSVYFFKYIKYNIFNVGITTMPCLNENITWLVYWNKQGEGGNYYYYLLNLFAVHFATIPDISGYTSQKILDHCSYWLDSWEVPLDVLA